MKFLSIIICFSFLIGSCKKSNTCQSAEVTKMFKGTACEKWAIKIENNIYPAPNLPIEYEQDSLRVCVVFKLCEDLKMCRAVVVQLPILSALKNVKTNSADFI